MGPTALLRDFCLAVEAEDANAFAALFAEDAVYHDVFYGAFAGRERIAAMIRDWFCRDATDFRWDMREPVFDGVTLYARYLFSHRSKLPGAAAGRAMFEGVAIMVLKQGFISSYREVANTAPGFADMGFAPERIARVAAKESAALRLRGEAARHLG